MTPQQLAVLGSVIASLATLAVGQGWISKTTYDWLVSPDTLAALGVIVGAAIAVYGLWVGRPHGLIQSTADLHQVDAVVVKPKTASEIPLSNVVPSVAEAAKIPGITQS